MSLRKIPILNSGPSSSAASAAAAMESKYPDGLDNPAFIHDGVPLSPQERENREQQLFHQHREHAHKEFSMDDHKIPVEDLIRRYGTNPVRGLRDPQIVKNRASYGANILTPPKKQSQLFKFFKAIVGGLNMLLWACAVLALISYGTQFLLPNKDKIVNDNLILCISLVVVVFISGIFSFYQEFKTNRIMETFKKMVPHFAQVHRNGVRRDIDVAELVVGDIVDIRYGDLIPADIRILESSDFKVDNSSLTGESEPQKRGPICTSDDPMETKNLAFFSTNALEGYCKGMVVKVGSNTFMGQLANLASEVDSGQTPIGIEMDLFIRIMTIRSLVFGGIFFALAMLMNYDYLDAVFFVIGIIVANVPEGLCVTFTIILALTAKRMAKKNCLVKNLQSVETLGSTSVICSDKTGTLTQNRMGVAHLWFNNELAEADTTEQPGRGSSFDKMNDPGFRALSRVAILCSRAVFKPGQEDVPIQSRLVEGDASETAILKYFETQIGNVVKYRKKAPKLFEIPFNSTNKFQISIHDVRDPNDPRYLLVMKGAPEKIINFCSHILIKDVEYELDQEWRDEFNKVYTSLGLLGERVLGFCDCRLPTEDFPIGFEFVSISENSHFLKDLGIRFRFVGLVSMIDPPRASVPDAVAKCRSAGIKVVMVTGDHPVTALAIARAVGIISDENETIEEMAVSRGCTVDDIDPFEANAAVISGVELKLMTCEELLNILQNYEEIVFARTSPEQKYVVVDAFQQLGYIVASTGDGVNDSPALKKADIGVAMGISGTEVSKETADMILMDDNFATIVTGVEEGRLIFDNLKKLIAYNLADNIAEMYSVWMFILLRVPMPMGTIAMLLSVVGTDVAPATSIAHELCEADIMKLLPRNPKEDKLVTRQLLSYTYGQTSLFELAAGFFTYFVTFGFNGFLPSLTIGIRDRWDSPAINDLEDSYGQEWSYTARKELERTAQSAFFVSIVMMQVANLIICKTRRQSLFQHGMMNWNMNISLLVELGLLCFFIYTPYVNSSFLLTPVRPELFIPPLPFALVMILYDELRKLAIRHSTDSSWIRSEFYT